MLINCIFNNSTGEHLQPNFKDPSPPYEYTLHTHLQRLVINNNNNNLYFKE